MGKNKHNDHLGDYVRKSFDDYEESPSAGMWGRIGKELGPAQASLSATPRRLWQYYRWRVTVAALFLLFSGLVCTHLYYRNEIRNLTTEQQKRRDADGEKSTETLDYQAKNALPDRTKEAAKPGKNDRQPLRIESSSITRKPENPVTRNTESLKISRKTILSPEQTIPTLSTPLPFEEERKTFVDFEPLRHEILALKTSGPIDLQPLPVPIRPRREPSGWYAGLHVTPGFAIEEVKQAPTRPGQRPLFVSRQEKPEMSVEWWLRAGKKLNRHFSIETGIGYREISREATHSPRFRFGDGASNPGGFARNFDYELRTYGGSASVSLRMEQVDPGTPVADDEPVVLRIRTSEHMQIVRIPVLIVYRTGTGCMTGVVKAGFSGNLVLKNELSVAARMSQNVRLRLAQGAGGFNYQFEDSGAFFPGYMAAGGMEFRLTRRFSLTTEASLSGDFPRKDVFGRKLPGLLSVGLNTGLNYYF